MRKLSAIFLLLIVLLQSLGAWAVLEVQRAAVRYEVKQQIRAGVPETELVRLKLARRAAPNALQWVRAQEFRYRGKMYDLVRTEVHGDSLWYFCLTDEKETQLFARLETLVQREVQQRPACQQRLAKLWSLWSLLFYNAKEDFYAIPRVAQTSFRHEGFGLKLWLDSPPTPPPEV